MVLGNGTDLTSQGGRAFGEGDASYQAAGGYEGLRRLCESFYTYMNTLPEAKGIRAMHKEDLDASVDKLTCFLSGWLGGPRLYKEKYGAINIPSAHRHLAIGIAERDAWLLCMKRALADQPYTEAFRQYMAEQLYRPAEFSRNCD